MGGLIGFRNRIADAFDIAADFLCADGSLFDILCDFTRGVGLFTYRIGNRVGDIGNAGNNIGNIVHRLDCFAGFFLNCQNLFGNFTGGTGRLVGKIFDLRGDYGKPFACFARAGGLDGCVQRLKIGLTGNVADQFDNLANTTGDFGKTGNGFAGSCGCAGCLGGDFG